MTVRRAIKALAYLWLVLATAVPAVDILNVLAQPPPADTVDHRTVAIVMTYAFGLPWFIAVVASAGCLSEMQASPRAHAPVWWLVVVLAAYGYWLLLFKAPAHRLGGTAVFLIATALVVLDIIELFRTAQRRHRG